ncbi:MAG: glycine dehydrogenase, partial [Nitrososphaeraceae archaeon]
MDYIPTIKNNREEMLKQIGVRSINDLIVDFKPLFNEKLDLSKPMSELELVEHMKSLSQKNKIMKCFIGAGSYN